METDLVEGDSREVGDLSSRRLAGRLYDGNHYAAVRRAFGPLQAIYRPPSTIHELPTGDYTVAAVAWLAALRRLLAAFSDATPPTMHTTWNSSGPGFFALPCAICGWR